MEQLLEALDVSAGARKDILAWYLKHRWAPGAIREMHHPFRGVLEVIRWFQFQPNTAVGLVTGRPETLRKDTLRSLNELGKPYRVKFSDELLYMNPRGWEEGVADVKVAGLRHFRELGYRVFAFIDNEPANLKAVAADDPKKEVLLLHANTIFESKRTRAPRGTVRGKAYRLADLIPGEEALPTRVQLVWHGVNDQHNLRQFLASEVRWAEVDARLDPTGDRVILRHDSFAKTPLAPDERWFPLSETLDRIKAHGRAIKIDLKTGGSLLDSVLQLVKDKGVSDGDLWFNANIERLTLQGFQKLIAAHPNAVIQCPVDFLLPLILAAPEQAHSNLEMLTGWGINRFSVNWAQQDWRTVLDQMERWGYEVNIYNVPDLESFLQAVLLLPCSVTSDFNFPQWHFYGHGSGENGDRYEYKVRKAKGL